MNKSFNSFHDRHLQCRKPISSYSTSRISHRMLHGCCANEQSSTLKSQVATESEDFSVYKDNISKTVLGIILGGGAGTRLYPLTKKRAKPAVPLGANFRLIDIPVSNCINSGINKIYCLTQFNSASLNRHLTNAYSFLTSTINTRSYVEVLAASQTPVNQTWFQGTADAVRKYYWLFEDAMREGVQDFLILAGDHLYRMDYSEFVYAHRTSGADVTIAASPCDEKRSRSFGLMKIDSTGRITEFAEKPSGRKLEAMKVDTTVLGLDPEKAKEQPYIASLGIYLMKADKLKDLLLDHYPEANDFGSEVIPGANELGAHVQAYLFEGYWMDIGTIEAFYNANLDMCGADPIFSFYDTDAPIFTASRFLPPSKILDAELSASIIGDGCVIKSGSKIIRSVIGLRSLVGENCIVENSLLMGADYYETLEECEAVPGCLPIGLGPNTHLRGCIIDKNVRIGANVKLINKEGVSEANLEDRGLIIKDGIIVSVKDTIIPSGTYI